MKKVGIIVAALLVIGLLVGSFYFISQKNSKKTAEKETMTEVQKLVTKDLERNYPETPREVVKLYNRIITAYYKEEFKGDDLKNLTNQAWKLFDADLQDNNPLELYYSQVESEIASYKALSKTISQSDVCDSDDVEYKKDGEDEIAYVDASYFTKEGKNYTRTYETYVLRKDSDDKWKILVYYQEEKQTKED